MRQTIMAFRDRLMQLNNADLSRYRPFHAFGRRIGWVREDRIRLLEAYPDVFVVGGGAVELHAALDTAESVEAGLDHAMGALLRAGHLPRLRGERYKVAERFGDPALFTIDRDACPFLGLRSWGFHLNGFVRRANGLHLWIAERARDKATYPGMLDNTVAGGQPADLSLAENVVKECAEEAGIPEELARQAKPVGAISYTHELDAGLKPDQMFCYDLELSADFTPEPVDGEVGQFHLLPVREVMGLVRDTERFKFNCGPVLIHFFLRHGLLDPDAERDYALLCELL
jgi:8-oxo-dGTP pyrophosphatase MutT (NUDIX family)